MAINVTPPTTPVAPIPNSTDINVQSDLFIAVGITGAVAGEYAIGDILERVVTYDNTSVSSTVWNNITAGTELTIVPPGVDIAAKETTPLTDAELRATPVEVIVTNQVQTQPATTIETVVTTFTARVDATLGSAYVEGDIIQSTEIVDVATSPPSQQSITWKNVTQGLDNIAVNPDDLILLPSTALTDAELRAAPIDVNVGDYEFELFSAKQDHSDGVSYAKGDIIRHIIKYKTGYEATNDAKTVDTWWNVTQNKQLATVFTTDLEIASGSGGGSTTETLSYVATQDDATNSEYSVDDELQRSVHWDGSTEPPTIAYETWYNITTGAALSVAPLQTHYRIYSGADATTENSVTNSFSNTIGIIPSGAFQVSVANIGNEEGQLQGSKLPSGFAYSFEADAGDYLSQITYDATGTEFLITIVRSEAAGAITPTVVQPAILDPVSATANVSISPTFTSSAFSAFGPVGTHLTSEWELYEDAQLTVLVENANNGINLTTWSPTTVLEYTSDYYVRVRYHTSTGATSDWSLLSSIITEERPIVNAPVLASATIGWKNYRRPLVTEGRYLFLDIDSFSANPAGGAKGSVEIEAYSDAALTTSLGTMQYSNETDPADYTVQQVGQADQTLTGHTLFADGTNALLGKGGDTAHIRCRRISDNGTTSDWSNVVTAEVQYYPMMIRSTDSPYSVQFTAESVLPGAIIWEDYNETNNQTLTAGQAVNLSTTNWVHIQGVQHFKHLYCAGIIYQWGTLPFTSAAHMFDMSPYATYVAYGDYYNDVAPFDSSPFVAPIDNPDFSQVTNASHMFRAADINSPLATQILTSSLTNLRPTIADNFLRDSWAPLRIPGLDTSNVTNAEGFFRRSYALITMDFSDFDFSNVTNFSYMFKALRVWNGTNGEKKNTLAKIGSSLDTSNATLMTGMFEGVGGDGYELTNLNNLVTTNVTNMDYMFSSAWLDSDLSSWSTSNVTSMVGIFAGLSVTGIGSPRQTSLGIGSWDVTNVTSMESMFENASGLMLNENFSSWNTLNVTNMSRMFYQTNISVTAGSTLSGIETDNVTNMYQMFTFAGSDLIGSTSINIGGWNVSNVVNMHDMFFAAHFTANLSGWNTSSAVDMGSMFAEVFDNYFTPGDITGWDVSNVTDMSNMFNSHPTFNQDLSGWCVTNIPTEPGGFYNASVYTLPKPVWGTCPP